MSINAMYSIVLSRVAGLLAIKFVGSHGDRGMRPSSESVIMQSPLKSGDLTLTQMQDGTLCILRNGIPCTDQHWTPTEIQVARMQFEDLKLSLTTQAASETGAKKRRGLRWLPRGYAADPQFVASPCHYPVQH